MNDVKCVFCKDDGFDLMGLKYHLGRYCKGYDLTPDLHDSKLLSENVVQNSSDDLGMVKGRYVAGNDRRRTN